VPRRSHYLFDNITPDEQTGIGDWSEDAFRRDARGTIATAIISIRLSL